MFNTQLPLEDVVRNGAGFFFSVIAGLFYIMSPQDFDQLCDKVYRSVAQPETVDVAEICAVAAVGSQYGTQVVPDQVKNSLFRTAIAHIDDLIETSSTRGIRSIACLCAYGIIEKRRSTRSLIYLGLQLARWALNRPIDDMETDILTKKLYRTMVLLEW